MPGNPRGRQSCLPRSAMPSGTGGAARRDESERRCAMWRDAAQTTRCGGAAAGGTDGATAATNRHQMAPPRHQTAAHSVARRNPSGTRVTAERPPDDAAKRRTALAPPALRITPDHAGRNGGISPFPGCSRRARATSELDRPVGGAFPGQPSRQGVTSALAATFPRSKNEF